MNVSSKIKEFLDYIETNKPTSDFTDRVDAAVNRAKWNKEWRLEYMKTLLHDMDVRLEGRMEGRIEHLLSQVIKKIQRGKSVSEIADALEEDENYISRICDIAVRTDINFDINKIMDELNKV